MTCKTLVLATSLCVSALPAMAADDPAAGIRALFDAHETAFNNQDLAGVMQLYAPGDKTLAMGTSPAEIWVGKAEIEEAYKHFFADFDPGTVKRDCPWVVSDVSGDVGWISANCTYEDAMKDKKRSFALNISVVVQKLEGAWKLRTMHFSNPTTP